MTVPEIGRWALVGTEPTGRFLLERWRVRADFPFVAVCDPWSAPGASTRQAGLPVIPDWNQLLADRELAGVILTVPREHRAGLARAALSAGKQVLAEGSLGINGDEACALAKAVQTTSGLLGVFQVRRPELDFLAARAAVTNGLLGTLYAVRWISCDLGLPSGPDTKSQAVWADVLQQSGPFLFDQLQQLTTENACRVAAWSLPRTAGFQVRLEYPEGLSAWIDLQRAALCGLESGWVLEGSIGGYRNGRVMTLAADGEILEEELSPEPAEELDVMADLRRLALSPASARASLLRSIQTTAILEAIRESVRQSRSIPLRELAGISADEDSTPIEMAR